MPKPDEYPKRRHAAFHIGIPELAALIDMPEGVRIHRIIAREDPDGIRVVIESPDFDEVEHEAECPYLYSVVQETAVDDVTGRRWTRWSVK